MPLMDNVSIRVKILLMISGASALGGVSLGYNSWQFYSADNRYSTFIRSEGKANTDIVAATRHLQSIVYRAYQLSAYKPGSPNFEDTASSYEKNVKRMFDRFDGAVKTYPEGQGDIQRFVLSAQDIKTTLDDAVAAAKSDNDTKAVAVLEVADQKVDELSTQLRVWNEAMDATVAEGVPSLSQGNHNTIFGSATLLALATAFVMLGSAALAIFGILRPIASLRKRMTQLAHGELEVLIEGSERRDEIAGMAKSLLVFQDNARQRRQLENEAAIQTVLTDAERNARAAEKARQDAETEHAISTLADALKKLADGNLAHRIEAPFAAQLDRIRADFNTSSSHLQETLSAINGNAVSISDSAREIRSAADDLAQRTEQRAASVEETAAALEQITTTTRDATTRAREAEGLVANARDAAHASRNVVDRAVEAMTAIASSSDEIGSIIGVIDDIAFQTNLLALNAGVEAARAGEAGKGFAVVAQEVRELAQRSAQAAKEIRGLINSSGEQVRNGVHLVGETGDALRGIVGHVEEINSRLRSIATAAHEQLMGLHEITGAISTIDQTTQRNAAMVEESTAATHALAADLAQLGQSLRKFKLGPGTDDLRITQSRAA